MFVKPFVKLLGVIMIMISSLVVAACTPTESSQVDVVEPTIETPSPEEQNSQDDVAVEITPTVESVVSQTSTLVPATVTQTASPQEEQNSQEDVALEITPTTPTVESVPSQTSTLVPATMTQTASPQEEQNSQDDVAVEITPTVESVPSPTSTLVPATVTQTASPQKEQNSQDDVAVEITPTVQSVPANAQEPLPVTETAQVQNNSEGIVVEVTPNSEPELPGESEAGAGTADTESNPPSDGLETGEYTVYTDQVYQFKVTYPLDFVFRTLPVEKLAALYPKPVTSFTFMNPTTASSDLGDLEPADLEVRIYPAGEATSLESWLNSSGFLTEDTAPLQPFQTANVSGVQVCASTMIVPGCSYFVMGSDWVYQLISVTREGDTIIETFMLIS